MANYHILTIIVLSWFLLSGIEFLQTHGTTDDTNIFESVETNIKEQNFEYIAWMGVAFYTFQVITPMMPLDSIPDWSFSFIPTFIYREWARLFLWDGYIAIPSVESMIYIFFILLLASLISIMWKRKKSSQYSPFWIIPLALVLIIILYPLWCAINIYLFELSYANITGMSMEEAKMAYIGFSEAMTGYSYFNSLAGVIGVLGIYKLIRWGGKGWKG